MIADQADRLKDNLNSGLTTTVVVLLVAIAVGVGLFLVWRARTHTKRCAFCGATLLRVPAGGWASTCARCGKDQPAA